MNKIKLCCFAVNFTHACIVANNFIEKNLKGTKIIYINEIDEVKKLENIISKYYKKLQDENYYSMWLNENMINDYETEKFVIVVYGDQKFVENVNKFLNINNFDGYIINCYNAMETTSSLNTIVDKHEYYINTSNLFIK